ncbi:MAG: YbaK/EbsC family protein [Myxococcota bacterium]
MSLSRVLESYLSDREATYTVETHTISTTSAETARRAHIDEDSLVKSVLLEDDRGFVLAVLPASCRIELNRISEKLGRRLQLSDENQVVKHFPDCAFGAVPPVGAAYGLATVIDASLEGRDELFFEGGDHKTLVRMAGGEFFGLLSTASVAEIAAERPSLKLAREFREQLGRSLSLAKKAAEAVIDSPSSWQDRLQRALVRLVMAADVHIGETEGPDGVLVEIETAAPRLWHEADNLREEHAELLEACFDLLAELRDGTSTSNLIRKDVLHLVARFEVHRRRAADLVYEAFGVDIGGG